MGRRVNHERKRVDIDHNGELKQGKEGRKVVRERRSICEQHQTDRAGGLSKIQEGRTTQMMSGSTLRKLGPTGQNDTSEQDRSVWMQSPYGPNQGK